MAAHIGLSHSDWLTTQQIPLHIIAQYLTVRKHQGASRRTVQSEVQLWNEIATELQLTTPYGPAYQQQLQRMFPKQKMMVKNVKTPLPHEYILTLLLELSKALPATDVICRTMAIRDLWIIILGFFGLLRRKEILAI